jgi:hypothetical protein
MILIQGIWIATPFAKEVQILLPFTPEYIRITTILTVVSLLGLSLKTYRLKGLLKGVVGISAGHDLYDVLGLLYFCYWKGTADGIEPVYLNSLHPALSFLGYLAWDRLWIALFLLPIWAYICKPRSTKTRLLLLIFFLTAVAAWILTGFHANHYWLVLSGRQQFNLPGEIFNTISKTTLLLLQVGTHSSELPCDSEHINRQIIRLP